MKLKKLMFGDMVLLMMSGACAESDVEDSDFSDHSEGSSSSSGLGFVVAGAGELGGDKVATIIYNDSSTKDMQAGIGLTVSVGAHYRFSSLPIDVMATVGYKYGTVPAKDVKIYIGRVVPALEASYWFTDAFWAGIGPVWHLNNEFHPGKNVPGIEDGQEQILVSKKFDPAMGVRLQAGWRWVALTYTNIKYKDQFANKYDASNFGLALIGRF